MTRQHQPGRGSLHRRVARPSTVELPDLLAMARPAGEGFDAEYVRDWLSRTGRADPEAGHAFLDELLLVVLRAIRDGHEDPVGLATGVLTIADADFPRWSA